MANNTTGIYRSYSEYKAGELIWKTFPPVLIVFGTVGNILSILVLTRKSIRKSTTALFLTFLTLSDLAVLYTGLLRQWIFHTFDFDIRHLSEVVCKVHTWLVYSSLDLSAWILIAVTLERIIAVWYPYSGKTKCSKINAMMLMGVILILVLSLNAHLLYGLVNKDEVIRCVSINESYSMFFRSVWSWIDLCIFCVIPFTFIVIGNSLILYKVVARHRKAKQSDNDSIEVTDRLHKNNHHHHNRRHRQSSMTAMLITSNTVFLITTLPISIYEILYDYFYVTTDPQMKARMDLIWAVVNMFMYTNNGVNFILYSLSGSRFRHEVKRLFCHRGRGQAPQFEALNKAHQTQRNGNKEQTQQIENNN